MGSGVLVMILVIGAGTKAFYTYSAFKEMKVIFSSVHSLSSLKEGRKYIFSSLFQQFTSPNPHWILVQFSSTSIRKLHLQSMVQIGHFCVRKRNNVRFDPILQSFIMKHFINTLTGFHWWTPIFLQHSISYTMFDKLLLHLTAYLQQQIQTQSRPADIC